MVLKCIIPAGGKGTRLWPYTEEVPKPLVEVAKKPLIDYTFNTLRKMKIKDIILVNGYKSKMIEKYIQKYQSDFNILCIAQKPEEQLGLPSTILSAAPYIDDDFLVLLPDFIFLEDMSYVLKKHKEKNADSTIVVAKGIPLPNCGSFKLDGDCIVAMSVNDGSSTPQYDYLAYGMDVHKKDFIESCKNIQLSKRGQYEIMDVFRLRLDKKRKMIGVVAQQKAFHITSPKDKNEFECRVKYNGYYKSAK